MPKPVLLILICFAFALGLSAQPPATIPDGTFGVDYNVSDEKQQKQGLWVRVYENGKLYYRGEFKDNEPIGTFWFWYDSGEPMSEVVHLDGERHMKVTHYYRNGKVMSQGHYTSAPDVVAGEVTKLKQGTWEFYNQQGQLKSREDYLDGQKHGPSVTFFDSGKILLEGQFVNDKKDGKHVEYFESGRIRSEFNYDKGKYHGEMKLFLANGQLRTKGTYHQGLKDGLWMDFNDDGSIKITTKFEKGEEKSTRKENGEFMEYHASGIPKASYTYKDGKKDGPFTEWYDLGEWIQEAMDEPMPGGGIQFKEKLVGTQVEREGDYMNDQLEGSVTYYDERGRITKVEEYEAGQLVASEER